MYDRLQKAFCQTFNSLENPVCIIEYHKYEIYNFFTDSLVYDYFKYFLNYDIRLYSTHSKNIEILINDKNEVTLRNPIKEFLLIIWNKINEIIITSNFEYLFYIFKYIFNNLKVLEQKENDNYKFESFNHHFRECLLMIINFINNLLYYYRHDFQDILLEGISAETFKILLKSVLKLNNYIIGISDFVDNSTLNNLSQKYFIFMDFFILVFEGSNSAKFEMFFFEDLDKVDIEKQVTTNIKKENNNKKKKTKVKIQEEPKLQKENIIYDSQQIKNNFYYQCFLQLRDIIILINVKKIENFSFGSFRLIIQFLYLTRFLKEFLEDDLNEKYETEFENNIKFEIINKCFEEIFDFNWLISKEIKNTEYSYTFRYELLILLNAYLDENLGNLTDEFKEKINKFFQDHE